MKLKFGEHTVLYIGSIYNKRFVRHQACCVVFNPTSLVELRTSDNNKIESNLIIVPSLETHKISCLDNTTFLFIDPNCTFALANSSLSASFETQQYENIKQHLFRDFQSIDIPSIDKLVSRSAILDDRIKNATNYIKYNLHKTITTREIVNVCFLSESRLQHIFKEQMGMSIRKYIHWQRVVAATKSIVEGNQLTQAAYAGGFSDGAHFTRTFKKMFGVPPSFFF